MNLRKILEKHRLENPVDWGLIEQDYALSWVLWGIAKEEALAKHLVFKGGTCLRKCYFGDYRFSQDLDFSVIGQCPIGDELEMLINQAITFVNTEFNEKNIDIVFKAQRYIEKRPHPDNQEAFTIFIRFPWQREALTSVMVEITLSEVVYLEVKQKAIIHGYEEPCAGIISTYCLEEIIAEKISALLSFSKKLHERGWGRSRARDYYDLWRIFSHYHSSLDFTLIPEITLKKCTRKNIIFKSYEDLFDSTLMTNLDVSWERWVGPLVYHLPPKDQVLEELKVQLEKVFNGSTKYTETKIQG